MTRISFWILLILFVQVVLCAVYFGAGRFYAPALGGGVVADIARIFSFNGVAYLSLGVAAFACFAQETRLGRIVGWGALALIAMSVLNSVVGIIVDHSNRQGVGWVLYPPLSTERPTSFFSPNDPSTSGLLIGFKMKAILETASIAFSLMCCVVILGKQHRMQWLVVGTCALLAAFMLWAVITLWNGAFVTTEWPLYVLIGLLLLIGTTTPNLRNRSEAHYALGAVCLMAIFTAAFAWLEFNTRPAVASASAYSDTYYVVSGPGHWIATLPVFILFAGLVAWLRPAISQRVTTWHASGLLLTLTLSTLPVVVLIGMPRRYIDYDPTMGLYGLLQGSAGLVAGLLIIGGIIAITLRRAR